jgi:hypothetical protein
MCHVGIGLEPSQEVSSANIGELVHGLCLK